MKIENGISDCLTYTPVNKFYHSTWSIELKFCMKVSSSRMNLGKRRFVSIQSLVLSISMGEIENRVCFLSFIF